MSKKKIADKVREARELWRNDARLERDWQSFLRETRRSIKAQRKQS